MDRRELVARIITDDKIVGSVAKADAILAALGPDEDTPGHTDLPGFPPETGLDDLSILKDALTTSTRRIEDLTRERDEALRPWPAGLPKEPGGVTLSGHYIAGDKGAIQAAMEWHGEFLTAPAIRRTNRHNAEAWGKAEARLKTSEAARLKAEGKHEAAVQRYREALNRAEGAEAALGRMRELVKLHPDYDKRADDCGRLYRALAALTPGEGEG